MHSAMLEMDFRLKIFVVIVLEIVAGYQNCEPGKITGITCSSKETTDEYRVIVEELKRKILDLHRSTGERTILTKNLIYKNIADSRNSTTHQIQNTRHLLIQARTEAKTSSIHIQACISNQNVELSKIFPHSLFNCNANSNFTQLTVIRNKILRLEQSATTLITTCSLLNPLRSDMSNNNLRLCIETKVKEIRLELLLIEKEFEIHLQSIVNYSVNCIMHNTSELSERIGIVLGAVKNCKNVKIPLKFV